MERLGIHLKRMPFVEGVLSGGTFGRGRQQGLAATSERSARHGLAPNPVKGS